MDFPGISRIYHGGGINTGRGFGNAAPPAGTYLYERIWIPAEQFAPHNTNPPNGPGTRALPSTVNTYSYFFTANELDLLYHWFCLPSRYWEYQISAPTKCTLRLYWYVDVTSGSNIRWVAEINYVRHGETMNFAPPALNILDHVAGTQYALHASKHADFPINNPSGAVTETEGMFYLKLGRDGAAAEDTFSSESYLLGASVEIPLKF